jgi:hypothetical protein
MSLRGDMMRSCGSWGTIHHPSFGITPLSASKIKKPPPKINNFTYIELDQIDRNP